MKTNEIIFDNQIITNNFRTFYNSNNNISNNSSIKFPNNKFKKDIPLTANIFKNHELQKSLSINIFSNNKISTNSNFSGNYNNILDNKNSFLTMIPINPNKEKNSIPSMKNFLQNSKLKLKYNSFYKKKKSKYKKF